MITLGIYQEVDPKMDVEIMKMKAEEKNMLSGEGHFGVTFFFITLA